jgi:hypothetical protein
LNTIVSPSGEWLAQPSTAGVFSAELDPGSDSRFTGADQSLQFFAPTAVAVARAMRLAA